MASNVSLLHIVAALFLAGCALLVKLLWSAHRSPLSKLPGPWYSKYTNSVLRFHTLSGRRIFYVDELHKRYGGVVRVAPHEVAVADLAGVCQIHKVSSGFLKSSFYANLTPDQNPGIFAMRDPYAHAARRKLFARAFSNSSLKIHWDAEVRWKATLAVQKIKQDALDAEKGADILKWWTLMATDIIAHLCFGESFEMLNLGKQTSYITALQNSLVDGVLHAEAPLLHAVLRYVPLKKVQEIVKATVEINRHGEIAVRNMRQSGENTANLFTQIVAASEGEQKISLTDKDVKEEAGNLTVAGSDTTAVTLTYLVWAVLKQPELQSQLEYEVSQLSNDLTNAELEAAPLLNSVIEETLRLYGAAPGALPRVVPSQGTTIGGYHIPGGVEVSTQAYTNHRDPSIFPDPLRFDGYRFMNKSEMSSQQKAAFMPFGGGSRVCLGIHLAYMELRFSAALFFRECCGARISELMEDEMMDMSNRFLIAPKGHCCYITMH